MPERAEIITRAPYRIGHSKDFLSCNFEDGDAGPPTAPVRAVTHIRREVRLPMADHAELPAAARCEPLLYFRRIGARDREGSPRDDVVMNPVISIGPESARWAARSHIVNDHQIRVLTKQSRQQ